MKVEVDDSPSTCRLEDVASGKLSCGPETLQVNLGNACQLNCVFCWNHSPLVQQRQASWHTRRMTEWHVENIVDSLPRLHPGRLVLSGQGEPLLHPGAALLLSEARRLGIPTSVQTNGVGGLAPAALVGLGIDHIVLNVSAGTPEGYERTHPGKGQIFEVVVRRLEKIAEIRHSRNLPRVTLIAVVQHSNRQEILPLLDLAARTGASGLELKGMEMHPGLESQVLDSEEREAVYRDLRTVRSMARDLGVEIHSAHLEQMLRSDNREGRFSEGLEHGPCYMGWYYLRVTSEGEIMFCCKDKKMGHLNDRPLLRTWRSPIYHMHRLAARDGDPSTGLFDAKCLACSNFERNAQIASFLTEAQTRVFTT